MRPINYTSARFLILILFIFIIIQVNAQMNPLKSGVYPDIGKANASGKNENSIKGSTVFFDNMEVENVMLKHGNPSGNIIAKEEELIIVRSGNLKLTLKSNSKTLGQGSVVFILPGDQYSYESEGGLPVSFYQLKFKSKLPVDKERGRVNGGSFMIDWNDVTRKETDKGYRREFFNRPTSMSSKFEMHVTTLNEGFSSHLPHTHTEEEIILLLSGSATMEIDGNKFDTPPGSIVFLASNIPHALQNSRKGPCEYFAFQWK